ncbi:unnamed protein product [Prunus armeniaca]
MQYAISVRDSNGIQIGIRAHLSARDNLRIPLGQKCPSATVPRAATRASSAWVSNAITLRRKISKSRLKTPTLGRTPYLKPLLFLGIPQKLIGSGRNLISKFGRNSIRKSSYLHSKLMQS